MQNLKTTSTDAFIDIDQYVIKTVSKKVTFDPTYGLYNSTTKTDA